MSRRPASRYIGWSVTTEKGRLPGQTPLTPFLQPHR